MVAVIDIARRRSYPVVNPIPLNIADLCRNVGLEPESRLNRSRVRISLKRIANTNIEAISSFYLKAEQAQIDDTFSVFQRVIFAGAKLGNGQRAAHTMVCLSDKILSNLNRWYIVPVDTKLFMKLVPIAGRLYELLSNRFFELFMSLNRAKKTKSGSYVVESYEELCKRMPLVCRSFRSRAQEQFAKAHRQLLNSKFLAKVEWLSNNEIRYYPGPKAFYDFDHAQGELTRQMALPFNPREVEPAAERIPLQLESGKTPGDGQITLELVPEGL